MKKKQTSDIPMILKTIAREQDIHRNEKLAKKAGVDTQWLVLFFKHGMKKDCEIYIRHLLRICATLGKDAYELFGVTKKSAGGKKDLGIGEKFTARLRNHGTRKYIADILDNTLTLDQKIDVIEHLDRVDAWRKPGKGNRAKDTAWQNYFDV